MGSRRASARRRLVLAIERLILSIPEPVLRRLVPGRFPTALPEGELPPPPSAPASRIRLYIAPANYAGQGYAWARAVEQLEDVAAVSLKYVQNDVFRFPVDVAVPSAVFGSVAWQRRHFRAVSRFSHVLIESEKSLFRSWSRGDVVREAEALRRRGVTVGFISHGSDVRVPSIHQAKERWSPFRDTDQDSLALLEAGVRKNLQILETLEAPVFASGVTSLSYVPTAVWLPVVVAPDQWRSSERALIRSRLRVVHAPSNDSVKGTHLIEPVLHQLDRQGIIEYRRVENVPAAAMPSVFAQADVVLDSFRIGGYGAAACEAMAAGRLVVSYLSPEVREYIHTTRGIEVPIVQAEVDQLADRLVDIAENRDIYRERLDAGIAYVEQLHDGRESARVLAPFLGTAARLRDT